MRKFLGSQSAMQSRTGKGRGIDIPGNESHAKNFQERIINSVKFSRKVK